MEIRQLKKREKMSAEVRQWRRSHEADEEMGKSQKKKGEEKWDVGRDENVKK